MDKNSRDFSGFRNSLTSDEEQAILFWLGDSCSTIPNFQRSGSVDSDNSWLEKNFSAALKNAVVCSEIVYRGLSDRFLCSQSRDYMKCLISGPDVFTLGCHASASIMEGIGRGFTPYPVNINQATSL